MAAVTIACRSRTAITQAPVPPGRRPAWRRTSSAMQRRSESADPASWNALLPPLPALSGKRPVPRARGTCRSGSRSRPPPRPARAGPHRSRGTTRCTRRGAHPGDRPAHTGRWRQRRSRTRQAADRSPQQAARRLPGRIGPPAFLFCWLGRGPGSHGLPMASRTGRQGLAGAAALAGLSAPRVPLGSR